MSMTVGSTPPQSPMQTVQAVTRKPARQGQDSDGDNDGSKAGEVEKNEARKGPVSATLGNNINTTA